jgi:UDP-N-acetylglucosamine 1-carboxyvinyltransferase
MDRILIEGGKRLKGEVEVSGSKNASLPIMVAGLLAKGQSKLYGVPNLMDTRTMARVIAALGAQAGFDAKGAMTIDPKGFSGFEAPYDLVRTMRASIYVMGPLLARLGRARVSLPGGCAIGARPIDLHLRAFEALGAKVALKHGYVEASAKKLKGARFVMDKPSVGATANLMMAASLAQGTTLINNAAQEPEIVDLAGFINRMGGKVTGAGSDCIEIKGVASLSACEYAVIPDRIEAGTLMVAAAITGGSVLVRRARLDHMGSFLDKLRAHGVQVSEEDGAARVLAAPKPKAVNICTMPHPGFPTDMQAQWMALMAVTPGAAVLTETIWENRFLHVPELQRLGADIAVQGNSAVVKGVRKLSGASVMASDLRASAALVLAGLAAKGRTEINRIYHLDRGYERMEEKLTALGARIQRVKEGA